MFLCPPHNVLLVWHWLNIFGTLEYHHETMCCVHWCSWNVVDLWPQGQIYRLFDMFPCLAQNCSFIKHWLTIFGTCIYHHERMCCIHSWSWFAIDLWPQGKFIVYFVSSFPTRNFCLLWHWHTIFGTWVFRHERMCCVHSWSWYVVDYWPQGQIYMVYDMAMCSCRSFFVLWHIHTLFGTWVYHHCTMSRVHSWLLYDLDRCSQYQNDIFPINLSLVRSSLHLDIGIPNFGISMYHHETTCCVYIWPLYDLDFWTICGWQGPGILSEFYSQF